MGGPSARKSSVQKIQARRGGGAGVPVVSVERREGTGAPATVRGIASKTVRSGSTNQTSEGVSMSSTGLLGIPFPSGGIIGRQLATLLRVSRRQEIIL